MKSYLSLIPISARLHRKQSRMTIICIFLAVFLVTVIFGMADMEVRSQKIQAIHEDGYWHLLLQTSMENTESIAARPDVKYSGWGLAVGRSGDYSLNGKTASVMGLDETTYKHIFCSNMIKGNFPSGVGEAALTETAADQLGISLGDKVSLDTPNGKLDFTITGFGENTSQLLSKDVCGVILSTETVRSLIPEDQYRAMYYVQLSEHCNIQKVIKNIREAYGFEGKELSENSKLIGLQFQSTDSYLKQLYITAVVLFVLVLTAGILMITSSLNSNVAQRTEFFGMLRCIGASKKQIMKFVRLEALNWCKTAIPLGIGAGIVIIWALCGILRILTPSYFSEMPVFGVSWASVIAGTAVGVLTVVLAAQSPAKKAAKVSPLTAVSGNASSGESSKKAASTRFFKVDTALGIRHATSSKKNFILMTASFALSIILFLSFSTAVKFMDHAVTRIQPYSPDISIVSENNNQVAEKLKNLDYVKKVYGRRCLTDLKATINGEEKTVNLISYEENQFNWSKKDLLEGSIKEAKEGNEALFVYSPNASLKTYDTVNLQINDTMVNISLSGVISNCTYKNNNGGLTLICSEDTFKNLTGIDSYSVIDLQLKKDATNENVQEIRSIAGDNAEFSDLRTKNSEGKGTYWSFALFIYGFLIIIALITVFNILNSVAMSVTARIHQYGAMRAIGMGTTQLIKMVTAETITYALVGSATGCILGLPLNRFLFKAMITSHWGDAWTVPVKTLSVILILVAVSSIAAVYGPSKKIHNMSVVDTISHL